jgi:hypothetical protein
MHPFENRGARISLAIAASICLLAAPALGDDLPWEQARWHTFNTQFISSGEDMSSGQHGLRSSLHTNEKHGFEFSRSLSLNLGKKFVFSIQGPLIAERAPGLAFEVRF